MPATSKSTSGERKLTRGQCITQKKLLWELEGPGKDSDVSLADQQKPTMSKAKPPADNDKDDDYEWIQYRRGKCLCWKSVKKVKKSNKSEIIAKNTTAKSKPQNFAKNNPQNMVQKYRASDASDGASGEHVNGGDARGRAGGSKGAGRGGQGSGHRFQLDDENNNTVLIDLPHPEPTESSQETLFLGDPVAAFGRVSDKRGS